MARVSAGSSIAATAINPVVDGWTGPLTPAFGGNCLGNLALATNPLFPGYRLGYRLGYLALATNDSARAEGF